ncbi:tetratricopeptide repeat protein [Leptothermofonsia sp. ETS-13]|uniref:tetratricopeptide repeat protein n=1 Tax=Leptothermofonsia sp. ETS-13 TaxID=3035696 RepID=UPI003B9E8776
MDTSPINPSPDPPQPPEPSSFKALLKWLETASWQRLVLLGLGLMVALIVPGVAGMMAVRNLLKVAESPDCQTNLSSSDNPSSVLLYCADEMARNKTVENLRDAIKLISLIPTGDPLRMTGDRRLEQWSQDLLDLGEAAYQEGNLDRAINIARLISINSRVYPTAINRIDEWKKSWEKAEEIYNKTQDAIERQEWTGALNIARKLVRLGNRYWETTKYQELLNRVQAGREQQKAERAAVEKVRANPFQSFAKWERGFELEAINHLRRAKELARSGTLKGLKAAVEEAQQIYYGTPTYEEAQRYIETWQRQAETIEDRYYLDRAIRLASRGNESSLQAAIDEAFMVSPMGSLYEEARSRIDQWMDQLYRMKYSSPATSTSEKRGDSYRIPEQSKVSPASEKQP